MHQFGLFTKTFICICGNEQDQLSTCNSQTTDIENIKCEKSFHPTAAEEQGI